MKINAIRKFHFCIGHRIFGHESKCFNVHGHNYTLWVSVSAEQLDDKGRVIDFAEIKNLIDPWLQQYWDHTFLVYEHDLEMLQIEKIAPKNKPWYVCDFNPTAENMVLHLIQKVFPKLLSNTAIKIDKLSLYESDNCLVELDNT